MVKGPTTRARPPHGTFWPDKNWSLEIWRRNTNDQSYLIAVCLYPTIAHILKLIDRHLTTLKFRFFKTGIVAQRTMLQKPIIPTTSSWRACSNRHAWRQIGAWSVMSFRISGYAEVITKWQASTKCRNCRWKLSMVLKGPWYCVGIYSDDSTGCITDTDTFCPQLFNHLFEPRENYLLRCSLERKTYFFATISPRIRSMTMHVLLLWTRYVVSTNITVFVRTNWIACVFAIMVNMLILMQNFEMERTSPRCWNICWKHLAHNLDRDTRQKAAPDGIIDETHLWLWFQGW